jgi:hypothetical protein
MNEPVLLPGMEVSLTHLPTGEVQYLYKYKGYSQACYFTEAEQVSLTPNAVNERLLYAQRTLIRLVDGHEK